MKKLEDIIKYIESDDKECKKLILECDESDGDDDEGGDGAHKKKKRRRKNRKKKKKGTDNQDDEEAEGDELVNLEFDDGST
jgi:hypothetical protein